MANAIKFDKDKRPGVDEYFKSMFGANQSDIQHIEIYKLVPFEGQPFKPYSDDKLQELADDIAENGVLSPLIVRPYENAYQILAGHNRANAAMLSGLNTVPCIVKNVDDDTAKIIMLNTNLNQRDELLPSEKAFAYKMKLDTIKHQGQRTDLTSAPMESKSVASLEVLTSTPLEPKSKRSNEMIAESVGESRANVQRFIRLTYLLPELMDKVDCKQLPFRAGVSLSYLTEEDQRLLLGFMKEHKIESVNLDLAEKIKNLEEITNESLTEVLGIKVRSNTEAKPEKVKTINLKIPMEFFGGKAPNINADSELLQRIAETINQYYKERN